MEQLLSQAKKAAGAAEVFSVSSEETQVRFEANRLKQLQTKQETSLALRIIKDGRTGYATTTQAGGANLVAAALETARFGTKARFEFPGPTACPDVEIYDPAVAEVPIATMIKLGEDMIAAVTAHTPDVLCEAEVSRGVVTVSLINSGGAETRYRKSFFSLGIEGSLIEDTDMLFVGESDSSCRPLLETSAVTGAVLRQLELAKNRAKVSSRKMPVIFTPNGFASALMMPLMTAFNGKTVLEGASPLGERLGKKVFDKRLCLRDDPMTAYRPASRPADDEGVPSRVTTLVESGVVGAFLYDLQTAALAGKESTGHGSRSRGGLPAPSPSAFIISPGETAFDDMIRDMK